MAETKLKRNEDQTENVDVESTSTERITTEHIITKLYSPQDRASNRTKVDPGNDSQDLSEKITGKITIHFLE